MKKRRLDAVAATFVTFKERTVLITVLQIPQSDEAIPSPTRASLRNAIRLTSDSETIQGRAIVNNARPATRRRGRRRKGRRRKGRRNRGRKHRRPNYATTVVRKSSPCSQPIKNNYTSSAIVLFEQNPLM